MNLRGFNYKKGVRSYKTRRRRPTDYRLSSFFRSRSSDDSGCIICGGSGVWSGVSSGACVFSGFCGSGLLLAAAVFCGVGVFVFAVFVFMGILFYDTVKRPKTIPASETCQDAPVTKIFHTILYDNEIIRRSSHVSTSKKRP